MASTPARILPFLVLSQFAATSVWFAGNAIYPDLQEHLGFAFDITPKLTIAVQLGFISGTLLYAIYMIPDRFSPARVFMVSASLAAVFNILLVLSPPFWLMFASRFLVGVFLAGVYPVGMKIASDWYPKYLGHALGFLVGALVIGTSFPHLIKTFSLGLPWQVVLIVTSILAVASGLIVQYGIGDGPNRKKGKEFSFVVFLKMFKNKMFNRASLGYFGHMWELYTFWAFVPLLLTYFNESTNTSLNVSLWAFLTIAAGGLGSVIGGIYSRKMGSCRVAFVSLSFSSLCALLSVFFFSLPVTLFLFLLLLWGFFVVMDSPQFSSVIAEYAPKEFLGSALTIVNSIGFGLTIISLEVTDRLAFLGEHRFWVLAIGPLLALIPTGKIAFRKNFPAL